MRAARNARAIAYEPNAERCRMISANANALGTPDLRIVAAPAPDERDHFAIRHEPQRGFVGMARHIQVGDHVILDSV